MNRYERSSDRHTALLAASCTASLLLGVIIGYVMGTGGTVGSSAAGLYAAPMTAPTGPPGAPAPTGVVNETELRRYQELLAREPKDFATATILGNLLYDAGRYPEAVPYYQQAFALDSKNANLSTDLGTALWYSGRPDEALSQYKQSLAADPKHAQTLFNMGIVRLEGKQDPLGAIEAWADLLVRNPAYPEADKVKRLISEAQQKIVALATSRAQ
jgi:cytochrome c-type biogenesis protein CcmH/NrfG